MATNRAGAKRATRESSRSGKALAAHQRPIKPLAGKPPHRGGPTVADRLRDIEAKHDAKAFVFVEDGKKDSDPQVVRMWIEAVDEDGNVKVGGDRISAEGATHDEACAALEAKLGGK